MTLMTIHIHSESTCSSKCRLPSWSRDR